MYALEPIAVTAATLALTYERHNEALVVINAAAGCAVTLPAATGSGAHFRVLVGTTITSNSTTIKVANADDTMVGMLNASTTTLGGGTQQAVGGTNDTISMNGTTTGGIKGSFVDLVDVAENLWLVNGDLVGSGTLATSLSATVS